MRRLERFLTDKTHVIWDWNGTLLNDLPLCHEIVCELLVESGRLPITQEEHRRRFRIPVSDFYRELGFDFSITPFHDLATTFFQRYEERVRGACKLFSGAEDLLHWVKASGKSQSVLSAANEVDLKELVQHFGIDHHFEHVYGLADHSAASKIDRGHALIEAWNADTESTLLIGDMDHDWEVAEALKIDVLLLGDGHQHHDNFPAHPRSFPSRYFEVRSLSEHEAV